MDRELLVRVRAGDREAFDLIVAAKADTTYRTALAILGNEADARDAAQDAFVAAWRGIKGLRDDDRFDAWLGRILVNQCRTALRRRGRVREVEIEEALEFEGFARLDQRWRLRCCIRSAIRRPKGNSRAAPRARIWGSRDSRLARDPVRHGQMATESCSERPPERAGYAMKQRQPITDLDLTTQLRRRTASDRSDSDLSLPAFVANVDAKIDAPSMRVPASRVPALVGLAGGAAILFVLVVAGPRLGPGSASPRPTPEAPPSTIRAMGVTTFAARLARAN